MKATTIQQFFKRFSSDEVCLEHLFNVRFKKNHQCSKCLNNSKWYRIKSELAFSCGNCGHHVHPCVGTIFEDSSTSLQLWFYAIYLFTTTRSGVSAKELQRQLGVTYKTAWRMGHKIREYMAVVDGDDKLEGFVEIDETYVGGKPRKEAKKDKDDNDKGNPRGRGTKKECVVGMIERNGKVKASNVNKGSLKAKDLKELVRAGVDLGNTTLITDEYRAYNLMKYLLTHLKINHSKEYANGSIHTNTIESFWALLKRGVIGQFHKVSAKYLQKYIDEFCWRFNERENENAFDKLVGNMLQFS